MLSALENATGSFPEAIKICGQLLGARGHVYPSTLNNVTLCAETRDGRILRGQSVAGKSSTALERVWLESPEHCLPYMEALARHSAGGCGGVGSWFAFHLYYS